MINNETSIEQTKPTSRTGPINNKRGCSSAGRLALCLQLPLGWRSQMTRAVADAYPRSGCCTGRARERRNGYCPIHFFGFHEIESAST
jgi:hypothetical protein